MMRLPKLIATAAVMAAFVLPMSAQAVDDKDVIYYRKALMTTLDEQTAALVLAGTRALVCQVFAGDSAQNQSNTFADSI